MRAVPWKFVAVVSLLAATPFACVIVDDNPHGIGRGTTGPGGGSSGGHVSPGDECNPVTNDGCPSDGSACDLDTSSGLFVCFGPPNSANACKSCDHTNTCSAGLTCIVPSGSASTGTCYRYCCADADCGQGGTCDTALAANVLGSVSPADKLGLCVMGSSPACNAPAQAPSGGSCFGGYPRSGSMGDGGTHMHMDGGMPMGDGGMPMGDGGTPMGDAGMPMDDGGMPMDDGGMPPMKDGGLPSNDGGAAPDGG